MSQDYQGFEQPWQPPPKSGNSLKWLSLVGIFALLGLVVCCGAGIWVVNFGMGVVSADIERQLRDHPQVREHLGEIQSLEVNWTHSVAEEGDNTFVYDVKGSDGSGRITVESITNDEGGEDIQWARLRLSSGETIDLQIE